MVWTPGGRPTGSSSGGRVIEPVVPPTVISDTGTYTDVSGKPISREEAIRTGRVSGPGATGEALKKIGVTSGYTGATPAGSLEAAKKAEMPSERTFFLGTAQAGFRERPQELTQASRAAVVQSFYPQPIARPPTTQEQQQQMDTSVLFRPPGPRPIQEAQERAAELYRPKEFAFITGLPLVKTRYQYTTERPTLREYSVLGFPFGKQIPVEEGTTYIQPSFFGRLQKVKTPIPTRKVSETDISRLQIGAAGVALTSPYMGVFRTTTGLMGAKVTIPKPSIKLPSFKVEIPKLGTTQRMESIKAVSSLAREQIGFTSRMESYNVASRMIKESIPKINIPKTDLFKPGKIEYKLVSIQEAGLGYKPPKTPFSFSEFIKSERASTQVLVQIPKSRLPSGYKPPSYSTSLATSQTYTGKGAFGKAMQLHTELPPGLKEGEFEWYSWKYYGEVKLIPKLETKPVTAYKPATATMQKTFSEQLQKPRMFTLIIPAMRQKSPLIQPSKQFQPIAPIYKPVFIQSSAKIQRYKTQTPQFTTQIQKQRVITPSIQIFQPTTTPTKIIEPISKVTPERTVFKPLSIETPRIFERPKIKEFPSFKAPSIELFGRKKRKGKRKARVFREVSPIASIGEMFRKRGRK